MLIQSGRMDDYRYRIRKLSFTGEPLDSASEDFLMEKFGVPVCSMYGTTETGVILASFPGFDDFASTLVKILHLPAICWSQPGLAWRLVLGKCFSSISSEMDEVR